MKAKKNEQSVASELEDGAVIAAVKECEYAGMC